MKTWARLSVPMSVFNQIGAVKGLVKFAAVGPRIVSEAWQVTGTVYSGGVNEEAQRNKGWPENGYSKTYITRLSSSCCWLVAKELQTIERHRHNGRQNPERAMVQNCDEQIGVDRE